jgi:phosphoribosylformylglycinamidine synthase
MAQQWHQLNFLTKPKASGQPFKVGDPFTGKLLMEACLELMASDSVLSIQDMGAAGLTSSSVEMASKGGLGMEIDLDLVPAREENMSAYELMLSESQERMLMVLKPDATETARAIFSKWDLDFMPIGRVTETWPINPAERWRYGLRHSDWPIGR